MGSARHELVLEPETAAIAELSAEAEARPAGLGLREQAAARLAAHRERRQRPRAEEMPSAGSRLSPKHRIAAAVAERYAQTPSYRAVLAEQAKRAIEEATAAAEVAMRNAEAVAAAQHQLLGELELWNAPQEFSPRTAAVIAPEKPAAMQTNKTQIEPERSAGLTVRMYQDLRSTPGLPMQTSGMPPPPRQVLAESEESRALDEEIAFRKEPVFEDFWNDEPLEPLPANLLEFPRQLIAARKARPRIAEGPLREEGTPRTAQLRIFEVEPEQISTAPVSLPHAANWSAIHLDAQPTIAPQPVADLPSLARTLSPQTAPLELRCMAALVDCGLIAGGALAFVAAYARAGGEVPLGLPLLASTFAVFIVTAVLYQLLFFTFGDQTPGMRYARIGLCTFEDDNPTRAAIRRRILAQFAAVCPLGLGLLWIVVDDDALGWHDRISRMYQRAY
jgi:uncharacterized RDD family membrane protein YckC